MKRYEMAAKNDQEPSQKGLQIGLQLVAMLRPFGDGNLQGFTSYMLGPHSILFGLHNDRVFY